MLSFVKHVTFETLYFWDIKPNPRQFLLQQFNAHFCLGNLEVEKCLLWSLDGPDQFLSSVKWYGPDVIKICKFWSPFQQWKRVSNSGIGGLSSISKPFRQKQALYSCIVWLDEISVCLCFKQAYYLLYFYQQNTFYIHSKKIMHIQ